MSNQNPLCAYNKPANYVCFNPDCKASCFICDGYNKCQCKIFHQQCDKIDWVYVKKKLNRDNIKNTQEFKSFSQTVEQLYQNTIKYFTKAYNQFKTWRDHFGLTERQEQFLSLIEEGRFTGLTGQKIYQIRNQIKAQSKMLMKSQSQIKQQIELIHTYSQTLISQLKGLYKETKITKEMKKEKRMVQQLECKKQKSDQYRQIQDSLANKILGLNQNGTRFLNMMNEGVIEKQLEKILEKINLNEESIKENKKVTNDSINNIKQTLGLRIQKLTETVATVAENVDSLKIEIKQIKQDINDFQKNIMQFDQKIKISNNITNAKLSSLNIKINLKAKMMQKQKQLKEIQSKSQDFKLFPEYFVQLRNEFLKQLEVLKSKNFKLLNKEVKDDISATSVIEELNKIEKEALDIQQQLKIKINQMPSQTQSIKIQCISKFFTKKLKKLNLLYRASENNFQVSKFWEKCNGKTNTVTILKTQFGRIIGGYTPLAWNNSIGNYQQDTSKQSFLFSITQKHKIPISQNQQYATYHHISYGPIFGGGHDICIYNKANSTKSNGNIGYTYNNGEYTNGNQQSYKKWSGQSNSYNFLIQQWEVYKITFE